MKNFLILFLLPLMAFGQGTPTLRFDTVADMVGKAIPTVNNRLTAIVTGRTSSNDGGGGTFFYDSASVVTTNLGTIFKPTSANGRWVRQYSGALNVKWFGSKGDGVADDTSAIQATINSAASGVQIPSGTYNVSAPLTITNSMALTGAGHNSIIQQTASTNLIKILTNNVEIKNLSLLGLQHANFVDSERGVEAIGTVGTYLSGISINECRISNIGSYAIYLRFCKNIQIQNNTIFDAVYSGAMLLSCSNADASGNIISNISPGTSGNAYGISISRITTGDINTDPRSSDVVIRGNIIQDIPLWSGLDTHSGQRVSFIGNTISNTMYGIVVTSSKDSGGAQTFAPLDCAVSANMIYSGVTDGTRNASIVFVGALGSLALATGSIVGNTMRGGGAVNSDLSGAMYIYLTKGLVVSDNVIIEPSPTGIALNLLNHDALISGNSIIDPWATNGVATGIRSRQGTNTFSVFGNTFARGTKSAAVVASVAIRSDESTDFFSVGRNSMNLTNYANYLTYKAEASVDKNYWDAKNSRFYNNGPTGFWVPTLFNQVNSVQVALDTGTNTSTAFYLKNDAQASVGGSIEMDSSNNMYVWNAENNNILFGTANTTRWYITSAGTLEGSGSKTIQTSTGNLFLNTAAGGGNVTLGPNGTGVVDISSGNGLVPRKLTLAQKTAIASPVEGAIVYQTDGTKGLYNFANGAWEFLASGSVPWKLGDTNGAGTGVNVTINGTDRTLALAGSGINPTDGFLPYRTSATAFGDSPFYRIDANHLGIGETNLFLGATRTNTTLGYLAGNAITTGNQNTLSGNSAGRNITIGTRNSAFGSSALFSNVDGTDNSAVGFFALANLSGSTSIGNSGFGDASLQGLVSGSFNTAGGYAASASLSSGSYVTSFGAASAQYNLASNVVAVGTYAGVGASSLQDTVIVGTHPYQSGEPLNRSLTKSVWIGSKSASSADTNWVGVDNSIAIGYQVLPRGSNIAQIGTNGMAALYLNGTVGWFRGSGSPESVVTAGPGSFYTDESGGSIYNKQTGTGNTGLVALAATGGGAPVGTVINSGTPVTTAIPIYSGTTGTNVTPSNITVTTGSDSVTTVLDLKGKTNATSATIKANSASISLYEGSTLSGSLLESTKNTNHIIDSFINTTGAALWVGTNYNNVYSLDGVEISIASGNKGISLYNYDGAVGAQILSFASSGGYLSLNSYNGNYNGVVLEPSTTSNPFSFKAYGTIATTSALATFGHTNLNVLSIYGDTSIRLGSSADLILQREAAATLQLGIDSSSPITQTLKGPDGSGANIAGGSMVVNGGKSTGTGRGGAVSIQTSLSGTTGSSVNSSANRYYASAKPVALTEATATTVGNIAMGSSKYVGATVVVTVNARDATDFQCLTSTLNVNAVNKAGTVTATITAVDGTAAASAGTLIATYTAVANGASVDIKCSATSSLTQTTLDAKWVITALNSDDVGTITPQ